VIFTKPLDQFDFSAIMFTFPDLGHGHLFAMDVRLHVYRDEQRWAVVMETVGYHNRTPNVCNILYPFGNCLPDLAPGAGAGDYLDEPGYCHQIWHHRLDNMDYADSELLDTTATDLPRRYKAGVSFVVRGQSLPGPPVAGEDIVTVLRGLLPAHRELFLADEEELRARVPRDLPEILRLDEWHHPPPDTQRPSATEAFRQIAEVIATGDVTRYAPTLSPNTHWSNWPKSGWDS
jgi:hypothetical protein